MSKRRHRASPAATHAETEVWPAYVDVLSAAFVFVLLAFAALLTRDVKVQEDRNKAEGTDRDAWKKYDQDYEDWKTAGKNAVNNTAAAMANELTPVGLPASSTVPDTAAAMANELTPVGLAESCTVPDAAQLAMNPNLVAAFSEKLFELDAARRHPVTLVCTFSPKKLSFPEGEAEPKPDVRKWAEPQLVALAQKVLARKCSLQPGTSDWCSSGIEVIGHTDCKPVTKNHRTNWELGSDRATWVVRQMLTGVPKLASLRQERFRIGAGGRADREPRPQTSRVHAVPGFVYWADEEVPSCDRQEREGDLARNRRVELLVFLRTEPLAPRPQPPKRAGP